MLGGLGGDSGLAPGAPGDPPGRARLVTTTEGLPPLRWGIVGLGQMAGRFARSLEASPRAALHAVASRSADRAREFARAHDCRAHPSYGELLRDTDVEAVYVATTHPAHEQVCLDASREGKRVLVEKPMSTSAESVRAMIEEARRNRTYLLEGYMYRFNPRNRRIMDLLRDGAIGDVLAVEASYGFRVGAGVTSRLLDAAEAGGGILEVGGYPVSFVRQVAAVTGAVSGERPEMTAMGTMEPSGVDVWACASLRFASGLTGTVSCGVQASASNDVRILGSRGHIEIGDPWTPDPRRETTFRLTRVDKPPLVLATRGVDQYAAEADAVARDRDRLESPELPWAASQDIARDLEQWRDALRERTLGDRP